jgi:hypothetical protein
MSAAFDPDVLKVARLLMERYQGHAALHARLRIGALSRRADAPARHLGEQVLTTIEMIRPRFGG